MASLKDTKRRIVSVKTTQKITKAMKLVSSSKFARANKLFLQAEHYDRILTSMVEKFLSVKDTQQSVLLQPRREKTACLIVCSTDRGLCGNLNALLLKKSQEFVQQKKEKNIHTKVFLWGKKSFLLSSSFTKQVVEEELSVFQRPSIKQARQVMQRFLRAFLKEEFDSVSFIFPRFKNILTQTPAVKQLIPFVVEHETVETSSLENFKLEPKEGLFDRLLETKLVNDIYQIFLNGSAAEHAARMTAMDNATRNADDVIKSLTLEYNRARQAAITKELIEIISGAESL